MKDFAKHMTLGILAGGKSSRMGRNKAELEAAGKGTFLQRMIDLGRGFNDIIVSEDVEGRYDLPGVRYVADEVREFGPLEGIWQILNASWTEYVMIAATDMPRLSRKLLEAAAEQVQGTEGCLVLTLEGSPEPLCSIYSRKVLPALSEMREGLIHRPRLLFDRVETRYIAIEELGFDALQVSNVNTPEDYQEYMNENDDTTVRAGGDTEVDTKDGSSCIGGNDDRPDRISVTGLDLAEICGLKLSEEGGEDPDRELWYRRPGDPPVFGVCGTKKTGKTTMLRGIVEELTSRGYSTVTIKHDGHDFEPDTPGTDSYYLREAGAKISAVFSEFHVAYSQDRTGTTVGEVLENVLGMSAERPDMILVEGLKNEGHSKLDLSRYPLKLEKSSFIALADMLEERFLKGQDHAGRDILI